MVKCIINPIEECFFCEHNESNSGKYICGKENKIIVDDLTWPFDKGYFPEWCPLPDNPSIGVVKLVKVFPGVF
jgi:hypothetical protein